MMSYYSIRKECENAGATRADQEVVVDQSLITRRTPGDLQTFNVKMIEEIKKEALSKKTLEKINESRGNGKDDKILNIF